MWGESPVFGGLGGTFPPRLSPEGKRERGVQIPCARQANHRHASQRNLSSGIHPASPYCHSKAGIPKKIKLVDIELLSIQIRLVICSVDKAKEMGMDWWVNNPIFRSQTPSGQLEASLARLDERLARLEAPQASQAVVDMKRM